MRLCVRFSVCGVATMKGTCVCVSSLFPVDEQPSFILLPLHHILHRVFYLKDSESKEDALRRVRSEMATLEGADRK